MRKIILLILLLLLPETALAWHSATVGAGVSESVACTTASDTLLIDETAHDTGYDTGTTKALKISLAAETTVTQYSWRVCDSTQTGNFVASLYTHNAGTDKPDAQVSNSGKTIANGSITDCDANALIDFVLDTPLAGVTAATYWVVMVSPGLKVRYAAHAGDRYCESADGGSTWTCTDNIGFAVGLYGCQ